MARPQKIGLDYFPFNVDFFDDDKLQLIEAEFGIKGVLIAVKLLCKVYKEGYYYQWGDDQCLLFSKNAGAEIVPNFVKEVVDGLVKRSFFDKGVFNSFKILTSAGIQKRYFEATKRRLDITVDKRFIVIANINLINANINFKNDDISTQRKENKSKENENTNGGCEILEIPFSENFKTIWQSWKDYKSKEHRFKYKTKQSEQGAINKLLRISGNNEKKAIAIINQSFENGWKGFFELGKDNTTEPIGMKMVM